MSKKKTSKKTVTKKVVSKKKNISDYTTGFSYMYSYMTNGKAFADLIIRESFDRPATSTSIIVPPLSVIKKMKTIKDDKERKLMISNYLLK